MMDFAYLGAVSARHATAVSVHASSRSAISEAKNKKILSCGVAVFARPELLLRAIPWTIPDVIASDLEALQVFMCTPWGPDIYFTPVLTEFHPPPSPLVSVA